MDVGMGWIGVEVLEDVVMSGRVEVGANVMRKVGDDESGLFFVHR
jgi:hypothetical protein